MPRHNGWVYQRFVAIGDSFNEGVGDPGLSGAAWRGCADRTAEALAATSAQFGYANFAIRGRLLARIIDEQLAPALELKPDLVSFSGGGNDLLRPRADPDAIVAGIEDAVVTLRASGADVLLFTGADLGFLPVMRLLRPRIAIFNENLRAVAHRHGALIVDLWSLRELCDAAFWSPDRLHLNSSGHRLVAAATLSVLGLSPDLLWAEESSLNKPVAAPGAHRAPNWFTAIGRDARWVYTWLLPWIGRRLTGRSSGDGIVAKRPALEPM